MKNKDFILINPNLNANPRSKFVPNNMTPDNHLENGIEISKHLKIGNVIKKTLKDIGAKDIVNSLIAKKGEKIIEVSIALLEYLETSGMVKNNNPSTPNLSRNNSSKLSVRNNNNNNN